MLGASRRIHGGSHNERKYGIKAQSARNPFPALTFGDGVSGILLSYSGSGSGLGYTWLTRKGNTVK
jgi:hypothetical protein